MIHKVNRPEFRLVVNSTKSAENDPGSSQGSGVAYDRHPESKKRSDQDDRGLSEEESKLNLVLHQGKSESRARETSEQIEFGNLVLEYQRSRKDPFTKPGLTAQYLREGSGSKGLLLNKKVE
ncbi:MAG: hypothetical protein KGP28_06755 [Bdellovibrionales bacterium]|nr:hypothetical protein [Bdellovibrionales bacterium]